MESYIAPRITFINPLDISSDGGGGQQTPGDPIVPYYPPFSRKARDVTKPERMCFRTFFMNDMILSKQILQ